MPWRVRLNTMPLIKVDALGNAQKTRQLFSIEERGNLSRLPETYPPAIPAFSRRSIRPDMAALGMQRAHSRRCDKQPGAKAVFPMSL
ncbi:MAG: hypothetical protein M3Y22_03900 [Pseudomonadota bacterium]|nr:hypothetical protein [Pseudomonadota bacterium]